MDNNTLLRKFRTFPLMDTAWQSMDHYSEVFAPPPIHPRASQELLQQYQSLKDNGPGSYESGVGRRWNFQALLFKDSLPSASSVGCKVHEPWLAAHVLEADKTRCMAVVLKAGKVDISDVIGDIDATAGFGIGFALACAGHYPIAAYFLAQAVRAVDDGTTGNIPFGDVSDKVHAKIGHMSTDFYETLGLPSRNDIVKTYNTVVGAVSKSRVDHRWIGVSGSYRQQWQRALAGEHYEQLAALKTGIHEHVALPLRALTDDFQLFTAVYQFAIHFGGNVRMDKTSEGIHLRAGHHPFHVSKTPDLHIKCDDDDVAYVESVLHKDRYSLVFPRFKWTISPTEL